MYLSVRIFVQEIGQVSKTNKFKLQTMTQEEINLMNKFEKRLTYRGICSSEWKTLIELRKKYLISKGENPNNYVLGNRICCKKGISNIKYN